MLRSKKPAAYSALARKGITGLLTPFDIALQPFERRRLEATPPQSRPSPPILLIVGAPRSGTTLVYQVLSHYLRVSYFTNLAMLSPRSPITATRWFGRQLRNGQDDFRSFFGNTAKLAAPNDGFEVWNRWLGEHRYTAPDSLDETAEVEMRSFFDAWLTAFQQPFLNKNNRNTDCIPLLASILKDAYFLVVRRNPVYVAQSLILAREQIQGSKLDGWGLRTRSEQSELHPLGYLDDVCDQVCNIESRLASDLERLKPDRIVRINYERFCLDPASTVQSVARHCFDEHIRAPKDLQPFECSNERRLEAPEFAHISAQLSERFGVQSAGGLSDDVDSHRDQVRMSPTAAATISENRSPALSLS